jgi:Ca2+-binding EF-hand superfamily protein
MQEFQKAVQMLNLPLSENETRNLFSDLDMTQSGAITLDEFREAVLGKFGVLGALADDG